MSISLKTHKILWARSGGKCALCKNDLVIESSNLDDDPSIVGDVAHIIARSSDFTRGDYDALTPEQRNHYSNLILLCKTHHKQIDDQPREYTVEKLRKLKADHESEVASRLTPEERRAHKDELIYSDYIDEWSRAAMLDDWKRIGSWVTHDVPMCPRDWYESQKRFLLWFIGRIWPNRHKSLEFALHNYKNVLQDLFMTFDRHSDYDMDKIDHDLIYTKRFYKIDDWDEEKYTRLLVAYEDHVNLVNDLFFELTRAANYVCDKVRETIFDGYRISEGALIVERDNVGYEMKRVWVRLEYRGDERSEMPYPGLQEFKEIRYSSRDYAINPDDPGPP